MFATYSIDEILVCYIKFRKVIEKKVLFATVGRQLLQFRPQLPFAAGNKNIHVHFFKKDLYLIILKHYTNRSIFPFFEPSVHLRNILQSY